MPDLDRNPLRRLLRLQDGVLARRQVLTAGGSDHDIERWLRRRDLCALRPGVYVDHTGPPTRLQAEWAAVLALWPAALAAESALGWRHRGDILVAVAHERRVSEPVGVRLTRMRHFDERVIWVAAPPRVLSEHAVVDVAAQRLRADDVTGAYAALAQARGDRSVNLSRVRESVEARQRIAGRRLLVAMVDDVASGSHSVLERGFAHRVERAHGLPRGRRQAVSTSTGATTFGDVRYDAQRVIVELDGRAFHDTARARDADAARDLAELALRGDITIRLTYGQIFRDACRTAVQLAGVLQQRGWRGTLMPCGSCRPG